MLSATTVRDVRREKTMLNIAHRGASGYAPENTRAAFDRAIAMGAEMIETDVQMTADGILVLWHDAFVDRNSNGQGPVCDHTLDELRALDLGSWFAPEYAGQRVLTVTEMLTEYVPRIPVVFEIKDPRATTPLLALIEDRGLTDRVHVTSFSWFPLLEARQINGDVTLGYLTDRHNDDLLDRLVRRGINQLCLHVGQLTAARVAQAHDCGLAVRAWGIDQRWQIARLYETGVEGATVNWPDWVAAHAR
jgi:glycerophosphoryl diester phosphodiesterase